MGRLSNLIYYLVDNRGKNPPFYSKTGIPVIDTYLINNSKYPNLAIVNRYITNDLYDSFIRCKAKKDDLLITLVGNGCGCSCLCGENQIIIQNAVGLRFNSSVNQHYMYYYFKQNSLLQWIRNLDRGSAQPNVKVSDLLRMKLNIPTLKIQHKIVNILSKYDELIENNNNRIKILEDMAQSIYKEWFIKFRFPGYENSKKIDGIPCDWKYEKFSNVFTCTRGVSYSSAEIDCIDGETLVNLKNIDSYGGFRRDGLKKYSGKYKQTQVVKYKDLVMGITDMTQDRRTVGHVALIPDITGVISADLIKLDSNINPLFNYCMFRFGFYSLMFSQFGNGSNVIHLRPKLIENQKLLIPEDLLIQKFVKLIEPLFNEIEILHNKNDLLEKQRDTFLPRLMSGKLNVEDKEVV